MSHKKHALKILGLAVMATLAISAFTAASAPAATWKVNGTKLATGEERNMTAALKAGTDLKLTATVLGQHIQVTGTALTAWQWFTVGSAVITQGSAGLARMVLKLGFQNLHFGTPAGCTVTSPIVTKALTAQVVTHNESETTYVKFFPEEGETLATVVIKGCALAGSYPLKGTFYAEGSKFGEELASQPLNFSPAINETLGGKLTLGTSAATLEAEATYSLESGEKFGVEK